MREFTGILVLIVVGLLISCQKPSEPNYENPYDEKSENFVDAPLISTIEISDILASKAVSGGRFWNQFGPEPTAKGVCVSTDENPTIENTCANSGVGFGDFVSQITDLQPNTEYFLRAFVTNPIRTVYGQQLQFKTQNGIPEIQTVEVDSVSNNSAIIKAEILQDGGSVITERGVCFSTEQEPDTDDQCLTSGNGIGEFNVKISNLTPNVTYYVRAFAVNIISRTYGNELSFNSVGNAPQVSTVSVSDVGYSVARVSGSVSSAGSSSVTSRGVCYATTTNPSLSDACVTSGSGTGNFEVSLTGLQGDRRYYVRAFATSSVATSYGEQRSFDTVFTMASCGETLRVDHQVGDGVSAVSGELSYRTVSADGKCWTDRNLGAERAALSATDDTQESAGWYWQFNRSQGFRNSGSGVVPTWPSSGVVENSNWVVGNDPCRIALGSNWRIPSLGEWQSVSDWSPSTVLGAYNSVLKLHAGGGLGSSAGSLGGRSLSGSYWSNIQVDESRGEILYVDGSNTRTQETNKSNGRSVRCVWSQSAASVTPSVGIGSIDQVTTTSARVNAQVLTQGSGSVTGRGVCYSTSSNPTIANTCVASGSGTGSYSATISGLSGNQRYYVRAYATSSAGTGYSSVEEFVTEVDVCSVVSDIDGNSYDAVKIGTQCWMSSNLKTTRYRDGSAIPNVTNATTWAGLTTGAWANYGNNSDSDATYGKLYNWHAVADSRNICPVGWHVPTDVEWTVLSNHLGSEPGHKMKSTSGWDNNGNGSNASGFTGHPGGLRNYDGTFYFVGRYGYFWSSSEDNSGVAWYRYLGSVSLDLVRGSSNKSYGFSVRCLRD